MFAEPATTRFDLKFRLFGIPVRVHPLFWVFSALFSMQWLRVPVYGWRFFGLSIFAMFFSVLFHEMGHAVAMRTFRLPAKIVLLMMGGLAISPYQARHRWQRIAIALAGPMVCIIFIYLPLLLGADWIASRTAPLEYGRYITQLTRTLIFFNGLWSFMNLLPIFPLDGGQVTKEVCTGLSPRRGLGITFGLSFFFAACVVVLAVLVLRDSEAKIEYDRIFGAYRPDAMFLAFLFGLLALQNWNLLRQFETSPQQWE